MNVQTLVSSPFQDAVDGAEPGSYTINARIYNGSALALANIDYHASLLSCPVAASPDKDCAVITVQDGSMTTDLAPHVSGHFSDEVRFGNEEQYDGFHRVTVRWTHTSGERQGAYFSAERLKAAFAYHFGGGVAS